jgi:hypothetical protein
MSDKVYGGTKKSTPILCRSCHHGMCSSGFGLTEHIHCGYTGRAVLFPVATCSRYEPGATASLKDMNKIAWVIESRNRGTWGFKGESETEVVVRPPGQKWDMPSEGPGIGEQMMP